VISSAAFMLAFLTLTTPLLLGGLGLLALPLIAHWLHRRSQRTVIFPSIALLLETVAQQSQFQRLKRWLLLMLRLLAVACIVLAFTRPVWQSSAAVAELPENAAAAVVLVLDLSPSVGRQADGVSELESLKGELGTVLDELETGLDVAGVVVADGAPRSLFPRLSANTAGLRAEVSRLAPGFEPADFPAAFAAAAKLIESHRGPRRLVVLSDLQRSNWLEFLSASKPGEILPAGTVVSIGARPAQAAPNIGLSRPHHFPALPLPGEPIDVSVHVANYSDATRQVRLICERQSGDGTAAPQGRDELTVALAPREERDVTFPIAALETKRQFVRFEAVVSDGLAIDNAAALVVETIARTPVIVLTDDDAESPGTAGYYLSRALSPSNESTSRFEPRVLRSAEVSSESLAGAAVIVVGYLGALSEQAAGELIHFVENGGGLIVFSGDGPVDRNLQLLETAAGSGQVLPWSPGTRRNSAASNVPFHLGHGRWQSRFLRAFDEQSQYALQQIQFERVWSAGALSPAADVLLNFADRTPAVGLRAYGRGVVVVANFSPDATTGDLARHGAFVAFTQMLVQASIPEGADHAQPLVGQAWNWRGPFRSAAEYSATGPDGRPLPLASRVEGEQTRLSILRLPLPGVHQLLSGDAVVEAVAAGLDDRESDLERIRAADIEQRFAATGTVVATASAEGDRPPLRGRPLWGEFFAVALAAIGLELFLLGWWRR
jgi:hypothetical protein